MFLRIAGYPEVELGPRVLDGCAVGKEPLVEAYHLLDEVGGMGVSAGSRRESAVLLGLVATQQHQVAYAQELQVQQFVFYLFDGGATADDVWLHRDVVFLLDGCCNGYRAGAATDALSLELSVVQLLIYIFGVVCCDVDECRIERHQLVDGAEQGVGAVSLQWRQHFEREAMLVRFLLFDIVCYCHFLA